MGIQLILDVKGAEQQSFPVSSESLLIGRSPGTDIVLPLSNVSRIHARVRESEGGAVIEDLKSLNGTFVNNIPIRKTQLAIGDRIRIGGIELLVSPEEMNQPTGPGRVSRDGLSQDAVECECDQNTTRKAVPERFKFFRKAS